MRLPWEHGAYLGYGDDALLSLQHIEDAVHVQLLPRRQLDVDDVTCSQTRTVSSVDTRRPSDRVETFFTNAAHLHKLCLIGSLKILLCQRRHAALSHAGSALPTREFSQQVRVCKDPAGELIQNS